MGLSQKEGKMEGWLYLIRFNRFGLQYSRKRYFVLADHFLRSFKAIPLSDQQQPVRSALIDSRIRVTDDGRESFHRKVFFIFTIYNTTNHNDQLKLGASSSEEAARWIRSLQEAALKEYQITENDDTVACSKKIWTSLRLRRRDKQQSIDWTFSSIFHADATNSDVIAPSPWKIFGCQNGLRLFKEAKDWDSRGRHWDDHPAIMAVGTIDGTSEAIFRTLMSLGSSRSEWDFCYYRGNVVEHLDGHTDIVHKLLYSDWLPWGMRRRDLLVRRYWRREDDGTYVILYHSVFHSKCLPQKGYVRACLKSGGFVISPVNGGKQSLVRHMLAMDWKYWKLYLRPSSARKITIRMLERLAALRELYKTKSERYASQELYAEEVSRDSAFRGLSEREDVDNNEKTEEEAVRLDMERQLSSHKSLMELKEASDEFFDVAEPEPSERGQLENESSSFSSSTSSSSSSSPGQRATLQPKLSSTAVFVKKLQDLRVMKKTGEGSVSCFYGATLPKDPTFALPCSWAAADPSSFLIRGRNYLSNNHKIAARSTSMELVGVDWMRSDKREDNLGGRPGSIVQKYADLDGPEFFFIVNIQVPGSTMHTLAMYYMTKTPLEENPLLQSFVDGDDAYRNSRFKLVPYISKGSWIVKQSVGKKACLVGQALEVYYFRGKNYLEVEIDVGSSTVARGVVSLVLGYLNNLVIEMAFLIQANTEEELPEVVVGTCRLNHLDASKTVHAHQ